MPGSDGWTSGSIRDDILFALVGGAVGGVEGATLYFMKNDKNTTPSLKKSANPANNSIKQGSKIERSDHSMIPCSVLAKYCVTSTTTHQNRPPVVNEMTDSSTSKSTTTTQQTRSLVVNEMSGSASKDDGASTHQNRPTVKKSTTRQNHPLVVNETTAKHSTEDTNDIAAAKTDDVPVLDNPKKKGLEKMVCGISAKFCDFEMGSSLCPKFLERFCNNGVHIPCKQIPFFLRECGIGSDYFKTRTREEYAKLILRCGEMRSKGIKIPEPTCLKGSKKEADVASCWRKYGLYD